MTTRERLLLESKAWSKEKLLLDSDYFKKLAGMHNPKILWVGSSDSLIPVRDITNAEPGEILVYRNIANQIREDDRDLMALLQDALVVSEIELIIVCAYSHCSGIREVLNGIEDRPLVREWLKDIYDLYDKHKEKLKESDIRVREKILSELNVRQQVINLSKFEIIQESWKKRKAPILLAWYFDLDIGELKEVYAIDPDNNHKIL